MLIGAHLLRGSANMKYYFLPDLTLKYFSNFKLRFPNLNIMTDSSTFIPAKKSILIIDDEKDICELIEFRLKKEGYLVNWTSNSLEAIGKARDFNPDLILLDIMMPEIDGLRLCSMIKVDSQLKNTPIIFLTARTEVEDRIKGFERGADDYITKPFDKRELIARVNAILSRTLKQKEALQGKLKAGGISLDPDTHIVKVNGDHVELTNTEFKLLHLLIERTGRVQSRENLLINIWNYDSEIETRTVDNHIGRLRSKLGDEGGLLKTVRGVGYKIVEAL